MMCKLATVRDEIKAVAENCTGTPTEKLVAILTAAGISSTAEIAAICGLKTRAVQTAKRSTMRKDAHGHAHQDAQAQHNAPQSAAQCAKAHQNAPQCAPECASEKPAYIATRANNESSTKIVISKKDIIPPFNPPLPSKAKPAKTKTRGTRLPVDWQLPDEWRTWARVNFAHASDAMVSTEADKFRDFWIAKAGQSAAKLDWQATWRNWCRNSSLSAAPRAQPVNGGRMAWDERQAAKHAEARKLMEMFSRPAAERVQ